MALANAAYIAANRIPYRPEETAETRELAHDGLYSGLHRTQRLTLPGAMAGGTGQCEEERAEGGIATADENTVTCSGDSARGAEGTTMSLVDALRRDEAGRVHVFSWLIIVLVLFSLALMPFLGGDPLARIVLLAAAFITLIGYGWLLWSSRIPARFDPRRAGKMFVVHTSAGHGVTYYFGVFSPCPAIVAIALYVFALGSSRRHALLAYLSFAVGQAIMAGLIIGGVLIDRGLVNADYLSASQLIAIHLCEQLVFLIALLLGRMGRRRTVKAVCDLETAVRELTRREALLNEAKMALARAEKGGPGRYTDQVIGSYRLGVILGRGAMGEIYEAKHLVTGEPAAVKLLHGNALGGAPQVARFVREVRVAASLSAPNLVQVNEVSNIDAPVPYLAMERLEGSDLWHILRERPRLPMDEVLDMVRQVSTGLCAMRDAGIVHRDLKPQNLFCCESNGRCEERSGRPGKAERCPAEQPAGVAGFRAKGPVWKVLDFGVSKPSGEQTSLTNGQIIGTPSYMAPEQARGLPVDHRADLYSLAVIAYRCLTGRPAFAGSQVPHILYKVVHEMPIRPSALAHLERDVDACLAIAMAKHPRDRFDDVCEFANHLDDAARGALTPAVRERAAALMQRQPWCGTA
ncbi:MAG: protein kinase [Proteobacteria bacterium]|nr:protein kinase [Pseudomonadota bacterium]